MRPLQGPSAGRGIGTYALGLLQGLISQGFDSNLTLLLDADFPEPSLPAGGYKLAGSRRRYHGQLSAYEEAVALGSDLQRIRPDVYHAIDLRLAGRSPCPWVVTLHDLIPWALGGPRMRGERFRFWLGRRIPPSNCGWKTKRSEGCPESNRMPVSRGAEPSLPGRSCKHAESRFEAER